MPKTGDPKRSKRQMIKNMRENESRQGMIPIIMIGVAALVIIAMLVTPILTATPINRPQVNGTAMGDPNAPVKVEEFADFQCPACGTFVANVEPQIVKDYIATGKVYFKFVPMSFIGDESRVAAEAAYCASDQGKFWEYHDLVFGDQNGENRGWFTAARLTGYASKLGLNMDTFKSCFEGKKYQQQVLDDLNYATQKNVESTPSFIVNGQLVTADKVIPVIESALKKSGK